MSKQWVHKVIEDLDGENILRKALSRGGDLADLFWEDVSLTSIVMEDGRLEKVISGFDNGCGLRVLFDDRQAFAATNELSPERLMELAGSAAGAVDKGREMDFSAIKPGVVGPAFQAGIRPDSMGTADKIALIKRAEAKAREFGDQIKQVRVIYGDRVQKVVILNSDGFLSGDERISTVFMVQVVASDGKRMQVGYEPLGGAMGFEIFNNTSPEKIAEIAASRALLMLKADEAPAGPMPVVLSSDAGGTMIHEAVGHGLEADLSDEGLSVYAGKIGEKIASPLITVRDDATLEYKRGSFAVDDEGAPAQNTVLVKDGVLQNYMYDRRTAMKAKVDSTGNGRRESFRHKPVVRMTNTLIAPGETDPEEILKSTPEGLWVKKMGGGQVDTVNGDFVFEVSEGYIIKNGRRGDPVRGATLTGNGPEVLKNIDMVGFDLGFAIGTCGKDGQGVPVADAQPTLRIPEIIVGGRKS